MIRVILADTIDLILTGMKAILREQDGFQVVGSYQLLSEMLNALDVARPDVILLGDRLEPDMDVIDLVEQVQLVAPDTSLILLSNISDGRIVQELFNVGIMGYLYRFDPLSLYLVEGIQTVLRGQPYLSPSSNSAYLLAMQAGGAEWQLDTEAREILRQMAQGLRPQEIAMIRNVSNRRVYGIFEKLRRRFGAETNMQLIAIAAQEGFLF